MKAWEKILIKPDTTILTALKVIDDSSMQIAMVVEDGRLAGTLTDGDIRRAILKGIPLESPVSDIMNKNPIVAAESYGKQELLAIMKVTEVRHIPIVDENGFLVRIETYKDLTQPRERENWVVLMAGGMGSRLRPLTNECPKPLLQVGNKAILETILDNFIEYGFRKFFISVNYKAEMVKSFFRDGNQWNVDIQYIDEEKVMGTAGCLGLLPEPPKHPFVVMNGDLLTKINFQQLLDFHREHRAQATMCVRDYDNQIPYGVVKFDKHRLTDIEEKPIHRFFVNAGIYVLSPKTLSFIPKNSYFDMPDLFRIMIEKGLETVAFPIREYWIDIGRMDDFERAKGEYAEIFK